MDAKNLSETRLRNLGIRINEYLPIIERIDSLKLRSSSEVVLRACVLSNIIGTGYGRSGSDILKILKDQDLEKHLTPNEVIFLAQSEYSNHDKARAAWNSAAVHSLAWALNLESMDPLKDCRDTLASHFLPIVGKAAKSAALRPLDEIYKETDFYYRFHWAARDARLYGQPFPRPEIEVALRRQALEWIISTSIEWDNVQLDT